MSNKAVLTTLFLVFLLFAMVATSSATTRIPGVNVGDWFKYGQIVAYWSSNDPDATCPDYLMDVNKTEWYRGDVTGVSGTNVTLATIQHFENGTDKTDVGTIDVDTGTGNMTMWVISANLGVDDALYTSGYYSTYKINETMVRSYPDETRETNHINLTQEEHIGNGIEIYYYMSMNFYWDKSAGIMVEVYMEYINQTGVYLTSWSELVRITDSNVWVIPEFPIWTSILMVFVTLTSVIVIYKRRLFRTPIH